MSTPAPPSPDVLRPFGVEDVRDLDAGRQSRVLRASLEGAPAVLKLTERRLSDGALLATRMRAVRELARDAPEVVAPLTIRGELVQRVGGWWMTATPFVDGARLDVGDPGDAERMGAALGRLHRALGALPAQDLPPVASLERADDADRSRWQLLHGDFSDDNVVAIAAGLRVFDFDDCGYGPVEHDVASSLYMARFDAEVSARPGRYDAFRPPFLRGYARGAGRALDEGEIDARIAARIRVLGRWLDDLATAPIGIRTSSPRWLETLRSFVRAHGAGR